MIRRNWQQAREKCDLEQGCRICGDWPVEAAHVIGRKHDGNYPVRLGDWEDWKPYDVHPDRVVPLCPAHHREYDSLALDLTPYLTTPEQAQAVSDADGIWAALYRTSPSESPRKIGRAA